MGRNPQTGEVIQIPAKTVVKFRLAKACEHGKDLRMQSPSSSTVMRK
jgi:nucleoid DNA-binding protein